MALFDFLKRKQKQEKHSRKEEAVLEREAEPTAKSAPARIRFPGQRPALISPHITERARMLAEQGQYTFRVHPHATKLEIRHSVERAYNVHVSAVRLVTIPEKPRRRGLTQGVKKGYKKALVVLRTGEAIDIF